MWAADALAQNNEVQQRPNEDKQENNYHHLYMEIINLFHNLLE